MLTIEALENNFYPVEALSDDIVRADDELPKTTFHNYFKLGDGTSPFVVSENLVDDAFAALVLNQAGHKGVEVLTKAELKANPRGFTHVLYAPHQYHSELKGRLDAERPNTTLCIPIFNCEFSGLETPEEFYALRRSVVPTAQWDRRPAPKLSLRFDNPKTRGGTGDGYVFARLEQALQEVDNLVGVGQGFVEVLNYREEVVELVFAGDDDFTWIANRDDATSRRIARDAVREARWTFLTR